MEGMGRFIVRRLIGMVAVLFAISVLVFLIFNVIPNSDPALRIGGKNARRHFRGRCLRALCGSHRCPSAWKYKPKS
jgi:ABC-type dipeptide/oligopeptide/nickel transport system permease component